jgi:hypothetical protein
VLGVGVQTEPQDCGESEELGPGEGELHGLAQGEGDVVVGSLLCAVEGVIRG